MPAWGETQKNLERKGPQGGRSEMGRAKGKKMPSNANLGISKKRERVRRKDLSI